MCAHASKRTHAQVQDQVVLLYVCYRKGEDAEELIRVAARRLPCGHRAGALTSVPELPGAAALVSYTQLWFFRCRRCREQASRREESTSEVAGHPCHTLTHTVLPTWSATGPVLAIVFLTRYTVWQLHHHADTAKTLESYPLQQRMGST